MNPSAGCNYAFNLIAAAALLAGCGGSQPPIGAPGAIAGANAGATHAERSKSWMLPEAKSDDLLYVSNDNGTVTVYDLRRRTRVGVLSGFMRPKGECVDERGDVFITDRVQENVVEYAHGGKQPIAVIPDRGYQDYACSIDLTTDSLAVANTYLSNGDAGAVAIYAHASGYAKLHHIKHVPNPQTCAYDDRGNLLIASDYLHEGKQVVAFAYRPRNHHFMHLRLWIGGSQTGGTYNVQWDGSYWALLHDNDIVRFRINDGGDATYEGTVFLKGNNETTSRFWIAGAQVVAAQPTRVLYWKYPAGGYPIASIAKGLDEPFGVTVSVATRR